MLSSSILLKNKEVLVDKRPRKIWEKWAKFLYVSKSLLNMWLPSLHVHDYLGWVIILTVHSHLWFIIPSLRFWFNAAKSSQCCRYVQEKSSSEYSSFCNTHKPSFSWPSSLKIAISSHTFVSEISNSNFAIRWLPVDDKSLSKKFT